MSKRDEEQIFFEMTDIIKSNLNTKIAEISAEKNDGITMPTIDDNAFRYADVGDALQSNYNPIVVFSMVTKPGETVGNNFSQDILIGIETWLTDPSFVDDRTTFKYLARFRRATREIIQDNQQLFNNPEIENAPDLPFIQNEITIFVTGVGVRLKNVF